MSQLILLLKLKSDWIISEAEELESEIGDPDLLLKSPMIVKENELVRYIPDYQVSQCAVRFMDCDTMIEPGPELKAAYLTYHGYEVLHEDRTSGESSPGGGVSGGKRITEKVPFAPTLYIKSRNYSEWKTLQGELIAPVPQGSIEEAKDFVKRCSKTDVPVYGNTRYLYQYIAEEHPEDEIKYDASLIRVFNIDIETAAENGFPDIETADQAILSISLKDSYSGRITVWGAKPFDNKFDDVDYLHFKDEQAMLTNFVHWW